MQKLTFTILILFLFPIIVFAEAKIYLKNGRIINCEYFWKEDKSIKANVKGNMVVGFPEESVDMKKTNDYFEEQNELKREKEEIAQKEKEEMENKNREETEKNRKTAEYIKAYSSSSKSTYAPYSSNTSKVQDIRAVCELLAAAEGFRAGTPEWNVYILTCVRAASN